MYEISDDQREYEKALSLFLDSIQDYGYYSYYLNLDSYWEVAAHKRQQELYLVNMPESSFQQVIDALRDIENELAELAHDMEECELIAYFAEKQYIWVEV